MSINDRLNEASTTGVMSKIQARCSSEGMLVVLWLCAGLLWYCACLSIKTPRIVADELNYWDIARSFHHGVRLPYWSVSYDIPTQLYSLIISPVFASHGLVEAYQIARLVNAFLIASVVFPAYFLALEVTGRSRAFAVAALSVATPAMAYSSTLMTENLFYPLFVAAFWSAYRALRSGRLRDCVVVGIFFAVAYYTKPHVIPLILAYLLCTVAWLVNSLGTRATTDGRPWWGFGRRLVPLAGFAIAIVPRLFVYPPGQRGVHAVLFGKGYEALLQAPGRMTAHDLFAAWSGLLLSTLIATAFVPFAVFVFSVFRWKNMNSQQRWFWLLTALVWVAYTGLAARHTVLNDGSIRVHERYVFIIFPALFVWYYAVREQLSRRFIIGASATAVATAAAIMWWPGHVFLTPHVNTDSPSLTGFIWLAWRYRWSFGELALLIAVLGTAAMLFALQRRALPQVLAWTLILTTLSIGWIQFEKRWINPLHVRLRELAFEISSQVEPHARIGVLFDGKDWLTLFHCDYWMDQPTVLYGVNRTSHVPGSFSWQSPNVRRLPVIVNGQIDFGNPAPHYLLAGSQLPEPLSLVTQFPTRNGTLFLYRIPQRDE